MSTAAATDVPPVALDADALERVGGQLRTVAEAVTEAREGLRDTWQGLEPHYSAPETPQLLAAVEPVSAGVDVYGGNAQGVGGILIAFAQQVRPILTELDGLRSAAAGDGPGAEATGARAEALLAELRDAETRCGRAIDQVNGFPAPADTGARPGQWRTLPWFADYAVGSGYTAPFSLLEPRLERPGATTSITPPEIAGLGGTLINVPGPLGPSILVTPGIGQGPEVLTTPPFGQGPFILGQPPAPPTDGRVFTTEGGGEALSTPAEQAARQARLDELARDAAHGGRITPGSRREAEVGLGVEERGHLPAPLTRSPEPGADLRDGTGRDWDVKGFHSTTPSGRGAFDLPKAVRSIEVEVAGGNGVIVDTKEMTPEHVAELKRALGERPDLGPVLFFEE